MAARYRGTGLTQEAVRALQTYLFVNLGMLTLIAISDKKNYRSARFLTRLGYEERTQDYSENGTNRFFELHRDAGARERMRCRFGPEGT